MEPILIEPDSADTSSAAFQIVYTGSDLDEGTLDASDFARALIGLQAIIEQVNRRVNGDNFIATIGVIRVEPGSFISTIVVRVKSIGAKLVQVGTSPAATAANNITAILGATLALGTGLFQAIALLNASPAPEVKAQGDTVNVYNININNNTVISQEEYQLANNAAVISGAAKVVQPLVKNGIDGFYIRDVIRNNVADNRAYAERITKKDLPSFPVRRQEELDLEALAQTTRESRFYAIEEAMPLEMRKPAGLKIEEPAIEDVYSRETCEIISMPVSNLNGLWQLKSNKKFSAVITDQKFLQSIRDRTLTLSEDDAIEVEIVRRFHKGRNSYEVVQVFHHLPGGKRTLASK